MNASMTVTEPPVTGPRLLGNRQVRVLIVVRVVNRLGAFALPFLAILLTQTLGASVRTAGLVVAAFGAASVASRLIGGRLADTLGPRTTIVTGLAACAIAGCGLASAQSIWLAAAAAVLLGLAFEVYEPASQALLVGAATPGRRPAVFGLLAAAMSVAGLLAGIAAAILAPYGVRWLFALDAGTCAVAAGIALALLTPDRRPRHGHDPGTPRDRGRSPWRDRRLRRLFAANLVFATCVLQSFVALPWTLAERGVGTRGYGALLAISALVSLVAQPLLRRSGQTWVRWAPACGFALVAIGVAGYGGAAGFGGFAVACAVVAVGEVLLAGHLTTLAAALAPPDLIGRYLAAFGVSWGVALIVAPILGSGLWTHGGAAAGWLAAAAGCAVLSFAFRPRTARELCESAGDP